ncbi:hypothetical protein VTH06DRAFT_5047 [Thermothelomyces fergusii]
MFRGAMSSPPMGFPTNPTRPPTFRILTSPSLPPIPFSKLFLPFCISRKYSNEDTRRRQSKTSPHSTFSSPADPATTYLSRHH